MFLVSSLNIYFEFNLDNITLQYSDFIYFHYLHFSGLNTSLQPILFLDFYVYFIPVYYSKLYHNVLTFCLTYVPVYSSKLNHNVLIMVQKDGYCFVSFFSSYFFRTKLMSLEKFLSSSVSLAGKSTFA